MALVMSGDVIERNEFQILLAEKHNRVARCDSPMPRVAT